MILWTVVQKSSFDIQINSWYAGFVISVIKNLFFWIFWLNVRPICQVYISNFLHNRREYRRE